jgi:hypothetical protein
VFPAHTILFSNGNASVVQLPIAELRTRATVRIPPEAHRSAEMGRTVARNTARDISPPARLQHDAAAGSRLAWTMDYGPPKEVISASQNALLPKSPRDATSGS